MANVSFNVITPATQEQIDLTTMKKVLRVDYTDEDDVITQYIQDARLYAEDITRIALAPQTIQATIEPDTINEGALSGPVAGDDGDVFRMNERVTTIPFAFYGPVFDLPRGVVSSITTVEYQLTPFDSPEWTNLAATDGNGNANYRLDTNTNPNRIIVMPMLVARRYRFTYSAGYAIGSCPQPIVNAMKSLVSFWYDNRQGEEVPDSIIQSLVKKRIFQL